MLVLVETKVRQPFLKFEIACLKAFQRFFIKQVGLSM
jgi:hypothetical protein